MREFSPEGEAKLTRPWEECVLYPYDDKVPKLHGRYPEYTFEHPPRGTITIGWGHTDAAGPIRIAGVAERISKDLHLSQDQADEIFDADIAPCVRRINRELKVEVTQHQFDMLCDTDFNCPTAATAAIALYNAGNANAVPAKLMQYTFSKGEHMEGLVHRRAAEIAYGNTPDHLEAPPAPHEDLVFSPKAERNPPPKTMTASKTGAAAATTAAGSIAIAMQSANEALEPIKQAKGSLQELGLFDHLGLLAHNPTVGICLALAGLAAFVWFDRRSKLVNDHV